MESLYIKENKKFELLKLNNGVNSLKVEIIKRAVSIKMCETFSIEEEAAKIICY